jgi:hypothetical protein
MGAGRWHPLAGETRVLETALTPEECRWRLCAHRQPWYLAYLDPAAISVATRPSGFTASRRLRSRGRNPVRRLAHGRFEPVVGGTRIVVRLAHDPSGFLMVLPLVGVALAFWLRGAGLAVPATLPAEAALSAALFVVVLYALGYWLARDDDRHLVAWLRQMLDATERPVELAASA